MGDSAPQDAGNGLDVPQVNKLYVLLSSFSTFFFCILLKFRDSKSGSSWPHSSSFAWFIRFC